MPGLPGYKGKITIGSDATVLEMASWAVSGMETEMLEDTAIGDVAKSYVPGRIDGGQITITGQYDPADTTGQTQLMTNWTAKTAVTTPKFYYSDSGYFQPSSSPACTIYVESITDFGVDQSGIGTMGFVLRCSGGYLEKGA